MIGRLFDKARKKAWLKVMKDQEAATIKREREKSKLERKMKKNQTAKLLNIPK